MAPAGGVQAAVAAGGFAQLTACSRINGSQRLEGVAGRIASGDVTYARMHLGTSDSSVTARIPNPFSISGDTRLTDARDSFVDAVRR